MTKKNLFSGEMERLKNPQAYAIDRTFTPTDVNGRDRNLIEKVYAEIDSVACEPEWEEYWVRKGMNIPTISTPNRKFMYDSKEWTYSSPHEEVKVDRLQLIRFSLRL